MGLGFCIVLSTLLLCCFVGSYRIGWLDRIAGSYRMDWLDWIVWIGMAHNDWMRTHSFMHWLVTESMRRMGRMEWMGRCQDRGGMDGC